MRKIFSSFLSILIFSIHLIDEKYQKRWYVIDTFYGYDRNAHFLYKDTIRWIKKTLSLLGWL